MSNWRAWCRPNCRTSNCFLYDLWLGPIYSVIIVLYDNRLIFIIDWQIIALNNCQFIATVSKLISDQSLISSNELDMIRKYQTSILNKFLIVNVSRVQDGYG